MKCPLTILLLLNPAAAPTQAFQDIPKPAPTAPAPTPQPDQPVILDPATVARLREGAFDAARRGDTRTLAEFFRVGQPADLANPRGDTLLILAAYYGHDDAVKLILDQPQTPINARNKMGFTALAGAAFKGYAGVVRQLASKKADLNATNDRGQTALMFAATYGRTEVVRYLVEQKADLKARDDAGKTALDQAKSHGNTEISTILEAAAQPSAPKPPVE